MKFSLPLLIGLLLVAGLPRAWSEETSPAPSAEEPPKPPPIFETIEVPDISGMDDEEFLDMVEHDAAMLFVDHTNPDSCFVCKGESRDVTLTGANGFGLAALCVASQRGWIDREEAARRVLTILDTYLNKAAHHHGALLWITDSATGTEHPYGGGYDIVETAYVCAGALVAKQYFDRDNETEKKIRQTADKLYERVEFDYFLSNNKGGTDNTLAWSFDPETNRFVELRIVGYHEAMIVYLMAMGSPTHPVPAKAWEGWTSGYNFKKVYGQEFFFSPALFTHLFTQAFVDLSHRQDQPTREKGITYFENSRRAVRAQMEYAKRNPEGIPGYGPIWGLSDVGCPLHESGFGGHGLPPSEWDLPNDDGTVAILSGAGSVLFEPEASLKLMRHVYRQYGNRIYDKFGFRASFNPKTDWVAEGHDSLNQGALVLLIENERSGLVWKLFEQNPEVQRALAMAGFKPVAGMEHEHEPEREREVLRRPFRGGKTGALPPNIN